MATGNVPKDSVVLMDTPIATLYYRTTKSTDGWYSLKLVLAGNYFRKANFWLGWKTGRFAVTRDYVILHKHYPEFEEWVRDIMLLCEGQ